MTVFESFVSKNIDELVEWLDEHIDVGNDIWDVWFDENYCKKCESVIKYVPEWEREAEFAWCELNERCRFLNVFPSRKQIIKMWLESECE